MNKKKIGYALFGLLSFCYRLFPVNPKKRVFYMIHNDYKCGNLRYLYEAFLRKEPNHAYIFVSKVDLFQRKKGWGILYFYFVLNFHMMTAREIYLNDNFLPLAFMPIRKRTKVVQLWHGVGALKKFSLSSEKNPEVRKMVMDGNARVSHLFVSGKAVIPFYEEAFQISRNRIFPVGLPVIDFYFNENIRKEARKTFYSRYEELKNKKILLYTPTFRKTMEENKELLEAFSIHNLKEGLGEQWAILMRLHPSISESEILPLLPEGVYDVSAYKDVKDLYEVSDCLVNDYSSTVVEYSLLKKPIFLFAPDLEKYDRGFYRDYIKNSPGEIVKDYESLLIAVRNQEPDLEKIEHFLSLHYDYFDSRNCERILNVLSDGEEI